MELNTIVCMDALDYMRGLGDSSVDMVVTSPPYDDLRTYNEYTWDFEAIAQELYRVIKVGGVVVWVVGDSVIDGGETLTSMRQAIYFVDSAGFRMHDTMIYCKNAVGFPDVSRYSNVFEYMFVLAKGKPKTVNLIKSRKNNHAGSVVIRTSRQKNGQLRVSHGTLNEKKLGEYGALFNVWQIDPGYMKGTKDAIAHEHPAIFPEELARRHIITWSNPGDIVLDPFTGSGTTAKMARQLDRHYIGCDLSPEYVAIANKRLQDTDPYQPTQVDANTQQLSLFGD